MNLRTILISYAIVCIFSFQALGQRRNITGLVTSGEGESLPGVNIQIKGTTEGTSTLSDGTYSISAAPNDVLVFTFIGMAAQEITVGDQTTVNMVLQSTATSLDELVVIGYGYTTKKDLTGAVGQISGNEITSIPIVRTEEALRGRVSGVQVFQNSGKPGDDLSIVIRGRNTINSSTGPIWIVDGFPFAGSINPNDVESITVLKDASSTAIYGSRGSNGVVLVTTKKGAVDQQNVSFTVNYGMTKLRRKIELTNAEQWNNIGVTDSLRIPYTGPNTDWQDAVYRQGSQQDYNLSYSSGSSKSRTFASINYKDIDGIVKETEYNSLKGRINYELNVFKNFKITNNLFGSMIKSVNKSNVTSEALLFPPIYNIKTDSGDYTYISSVGESNPVGSIYGRIDDWRYYKMYDQLGAELKLFDKLTLKSSLSGATDNQHNQNFTSRTIQNAYSGRGKAGQKYKIYREWTNENQLVYKDKFLLYHNVGATVFFSQEYKRVESFEANNQLLLTEQLLYNNLNLNDTMATVGSTANQETLLSFGARFDYDFKSKYYLTFTFRRDASSKFSENNKWANFPALALSWRVNEESFMKNISMISNLKLRLSYGKTGNQGLDPGQTLEKYTLSSNRAIFNNQPQQALDINVRYNPDLTWEKTDQYDGGIDLSVFKNRISLTLDYYYKLTRDLLFQKSVPETAGGGSMYINKGKIQNKGLEISMNTVIFQKANFGWNSDLTYSYNRNKVLDLEDTKVYTLGQIAGGWINDETHFFMEGYPMGIFKGYLVEGVFKDNADAAAYPDQTGIGIPNKPGEYKIKDINNDGIIDQNDKTIIGNAEPDFIFGFNNEFKYKSFTFSFFIQGSVGNEVYNILNVALNGGLKTYNRSTDYLDYWSPENTVTNTPAPGAVVTKSLSVYVEDGSYVKLRDISLSYTLPGKISSRLKLSHLSVSVSAQNYLTFTRYKGYDPEVSTWGNSNLYQGIDWGSYPSSKSITFGIKLEI